ncbi:phosphoglycerate kinase [bacterium]|nr:phosphoglycerate kinase [Candidatus Elulimicrobium humile]
MRYIKDYTTLLAGKRVLLRIDVNEPVDERGFPQDTFRIAKALRTINFLRQAGAKIVLIAHLGDPQKEGRAGLSLRLIVEKLAELGGFGIKFIAGDIAKVNPDISYQIPDGEVICLENLRFDTREEENSKEFAKMLAQFADLYVSDAFSVMHRQHTSVVAITELLPSFGGLILEQELEALNHILHNPAKPAVAIIGGAKISTKLPVIKALEFSFDYILVGGKIANEYIDEYNIAQSEKIILPVDFVETDRYDIGPKTRKLFADYITKASTIIWNGPMGWFEQKPYDEGTKSIAQSIAKNESSYSVIGGGETIDEVHNLKQESKIDFISTGGGAMLEYISKQGDLPGIIALENSNLDI